MASELLFNVIQLHQAVSISIQEIRVACAEASRLLIIAVSTQWYHAGCSSLNPA